MPLRGCRKASNRRSSNPTRSTACCRRAPCTKAWPCARSRLEPLELEAACAPPDGRSVLGARRRHRSAERRRGIPFRCRVRRARCDPAGPQIAAADRRAGESRRRRNRTRAARARREPRPRRSRRCARWATSPSRSKAKLSWRLPKRWPTTRRRARARRRGQRFAPGRRGSVREARAHSDRAGDGELERLRRRRDRALRSANARASARRLAPPRKSMLFIRKNTPMMIEIAEEEHEHLRPERFFHQSAASVTSPPSPASTGASVRWRCG